MITLKQYKTFNNETGEIKVDCKICTGCKGNYLVYSNNSVIYDADIISDAVNYYNKVLEMDRYIASKVHSYEVYILLE